MTMDKEQVRRDALRQSLVAALNGHSVSPKTCGAILTRWDALEQAERERDRFKAEVIDNTAAMRLAAEEMKRVKGRLASVPALVEALRCISEFGDEVCKRRVAQDALTVYEQSHGGTDG